MLCGGMGTRCPVKGRSKPLNDIMGRPMIRRVLDVLLQSIDEMAIVTSCPQLRAYVERRYPHVRFAFADTPYQTRGPAETALLGLRQLEHFCDANKQVLVLDNDCVYTGVDLCSGLPQGNFLICTHAPALGGPTHFSFVDAIPGSTKVIDIRERDSGGGELVCMGGYGFADLATCMRCCEMAVMLAPVGTEPYMSSAMRSMLPAVSAVILPDAFTVGTPLDIQINADKMCHDAVPDHMLPEPDESRCNNSRFRSMCDNTVQLVSWGDTTAVHKSGPVDVIAAEVAYYNALFARSPAASTMFPKMLAAGKGFMVLERVTGGARLSDLYAAGLLSPQLVHHVIQQARELHTSSRLNATLHDIDVERHYLGKLERRAAIATDYPFADAEEVTEQVRLLGRKFVDFVRHAPVEPVIHGDLWFSNVLLSTSPERPVVFIDPRARFDGQATTCGHRFYDWAKMLMSITGLDVALDHGMLVDPQTRTVVEASFWSGLALTADEQKNVQGLAAVLMHGTFFSFPSDLPIDRRQLAWQMLKDLVAGALT